MGRIPEAELEALKAQVDLLALIQAHGVELKKSGENWLGHCPFHDDRTPSLVVTPSKNLWHCLGACQAGGTAIDWVMRRDRVTFRHAVELLRSGDAAVVTAKRERFWAPKLPSPVEATAEDGKLLRQVAEFYHETLQTRAPEALSYLAARGLECAKAIEKFRIGFCNRTLGLRLPEARRSDGAEIRGRLTKLGVYRESGHEHLDGCVVVPVIDGDGAVTEMYGRRIDRVRSGQPAHWYLPGPHRGVWNPEALESREIILCEALLDALTFWCAGFPSVTSAYGIEGFTTEIEAALVAAQVRRVWIAFDRDEAGDRGAVKVAERLKAHGIETLRVKFPKGMDANAYGLKVTPAHDSLGLVLKSAEVIWKSPAKAKPATLPKASSILAAQVPSVASALATAPIFKEALKPVQENPTQAPSDGNGAVTVTAELRGEDVLIRIGDREYRVRGLLKNLAYDVLKVNLRAAGPRGFHVDQLDLYQAKARAAFIAVASAEMAIETAVVKADLGRVLVKLEELQEENIRRQLKGEKQRAEVFISESERNEAMALLKAPDLLGRVLRDFAACGVVGEETNKLVGYLAATSRKLEDPLAVVIQSSSSAGKSSLMEAVLAMMPPEEVVKYSAMTGQALYYMGEGDLKHRVLAVAEEAGASRAAYALKLLQSEGEISIASTGKDPTSGKLITHQYRVEGPVQIFLTTTAIDLDEELMNRCLVLSVSEDRMQTAAIHEQQRMRQTVEGLLARRERARVVRLHQNAQRILRPLQVVNPYARELKFTDSRTRARRDHLKYLTLIRAIALLHQFQRKVHEVEHGGEVIEYIEVESCDIEVANRIAQEVLSRGWDDVSPQTKRMLELVRLHVAAECERRKIERTEYRFTRKEVRAWSGWSDFQVQKHLTRLAELEYLACVRDGRGNKTHYQLTWEESSAASGVQPPEGRRLELVMPQAQAAPVSLTPRLWPLTQHLLHPEGETLAPFSPAIENSSTPEKQDLSEESRGDGSQLLHSGENHVTGAWKKERIVRPSPPSSSGVEVPQAAKKRAKGEGR